VQQDARAVSLEWDASGGLLLLATHQSASVWDAQGNMVRTFADTLVVNVQHASWRWQNEIMVQCKNGLWMWRHGERPVSLFEESVMQAKWSSNKTYLAILQETQIGIYQDECDIWWINKECSAVAFGSKDYLLAAASCSGEVLLWDLDRRSVVNKFSTSVGKVEKVAFRKDDEFIAVAGEEEVQAWNLDDLGMVRKVKVGCRISEM
jgi:WD40 repeat protein